MVRVVSLVCSVIDYVLQGGEVVFDGLPARLCESKSRSRVLADIPFGHLNVGARLKPGDLLRQRGLCHASAFTHKRKVCPITCREYCEDLEPCGISQEWIKMHGLTPGWP